MAVGRPRLTPRGYKTTSVVLTAELLETIDQACLAAESDNRSAFIRRILKLGLAEFMASHPVAVTPAHSLEDRERDMRLGG